MVQCLQAQLTPRQLRTVWFDSAEVQTEPLEIEVGATLMNNSSLRTQLTQALADHQEAGPALVSISYLQISQ